MMKSMPVLPKLVQHLAVYVKVFGVVVELTQTESLQICDAASTIIRMKVEQFSHGMPKDWPTSIQAVLENF